MIGPQVGLNRFYLDDDMQKIYGWYTYFWSGLDFWENLRRANMCHGLKITPLNLLQNRNFDKL